MIWMEYTNKKFAQILKSDRESCDIKENLHFLFLLPSLKQEQSVDILYVAW